MIRVEALGGLRIFVGDQESASLAKQRLKCGLVVFLAVERSVLRESLLNTFWPDREPERARHALSQTLYELRKILGDDWLSVTGDRLTVAEHVRCDVVDFMESVDSGFIQHALECYHGPFLANCYLAETREFEEWSDRRQERVTKMLRRALREASQLEETPPWIEHAIEAARRAAEQNSTDDDVQHALLQLLVRAGRRSDALAQYERYEAALAEDKLEPLEHTKQLMAVARESSETSAPPKLFALPETSYQPPAGQQGASVEPVQPEIKFPLKTTLGVLLVLAVAALVPWLIADSPERGSASKASNPIIAVRSFEDLSPRDTFEYFANALTEGLIDEFSHVQGLEVLSRSAVQHLQQKLAGPDSVEKELRVDYYIAGTTELQGERLQVTVRLLDAEERILRSKSINRPLKDLQELRNDVMDEVAVFFRPDLGRRVELSRRRSETRNREAFDAYLRAKQRLGDFAKLLATRDGLAGAESALKSADSLLVLATQHDRTWNAPIILRGQIASMNAQVAMYRGGAERAARFRDALDRGIEFASRAIQNNDRDAEAYALRGELRYRIWFTSTIRDSSEFEIIRDSSTFDLQRAVELDSLLIEAQSTLSDVYLLQARYSEARLAAKRAYDLDRYYLGALNVLSRLATAAFESGLEEEATQWCREGERRFPQYHQFLDCRMRLLAWGNQTRPDVDSAQALLARSAKLHGNAPTQDLDRMFRLMAASVYARAGRRDEALRLISEHRGNDFDFTLLWIEAAARARLEQSDLAVTLLARALEGEPFKRERTIKSRAFAPLASHPGFIQLSNSLGLR